MQGVTRKIVYVVLFEGFAIAICSVGFMLAAGAELARASALSIACSVVAVLWNLVFNHGFECWEARQPVRGRGLARRAAHALGFEFGLLILLVPLIAWWLEVSLWQALVMDVVLALFFLVYTFCFTWIFDRVFGLPASATASA